MLLLGANAWKRTRINLSGQWQCHKRFWRLAQALHGNTSSISSMATSLPGSLVSAGLEPEKASLLWAWLSCLIPHGAPSGRGRPPTTPPSPPAYHSWLIMSHRQIAILSEFQTMAIPALAIASLPALPGLPAVPIWSNHIISADQEKRSQRKPKSVDCWNCCQVAPVNKPVQAPCKQTRFRLHLYKLMHPWQGKVILMDKTTVLASCRLLPSRRWSVKPPLARAARGSHIHRQLYTCQRVFWKRWQRQPAALPEKRHILIHLAQISRFAMIS